MDTKTIRGGNTREQLLGIATRLFTERGYEGSSIETVLAESTVSRGALYYHFRSKEALFEAVLEALYDRVGGQVLEAIGDEQDPIQALRLGCTAWSRIASDPAVRQMLFIDAPAVLGWQRWRQIDEERTLGCVQNALTAAAANGAFEPAYVQFFAHAIFAGLNEIVMMVAQSANPQAAQRSADHAMSELLDRILGPANEHA